MGGEHESFMGQQCSTWAVGAAGHRTHCFPNHPFAVITGCDRATQLIFLIEISCYLVFSLRFLLQISHICQIQHGPGASTISETFCINSSASTINTTKL